MTDLCGPDLDDLLRRHHDDEVRATVLAIKDRLSALDTETDPVRKAALMDEVRDLHIVLEHELQEAGRTFDDFINDDAF